jgi:hypothetical protein
MGELLDKLGNKVAGQLIRSEDWNALVAAVDGLQAQVATVQSTLTAQITGVQGEVGQLRTEFNSLQEQVNSVFGDYFRVAMRTSQLSYAIGDLAEITAQITDLFGRPLVLRAEQERPWIDFVTLWGQLKPAPGFTSRGGASDRTIAVQMNAEGTARVLLRADHAESFSDDEEDEVAGTLATIIPNTNFTYKEAILNARTPVEAKEKGFFRVMTREYDRRDARTLRRYNDTYYLKNPEILGRPRSPGIFHSWRDYRSTVLAFASADGDPRSPDQSRGISSIQVTFRDWISPWLNLEYLVEIGDLTKEVSGKLKGSIRGTYADSVGRIQEVLGDFTTEAGVLGKVRNYGVVNEAFTQVDLPTPPTYFDALSKNMRNAVKFQQALVNSDTAVAVEAFTGVAVRIEQRTDDVDRKVGLTDDRFGGMVDAAVERFGRQVAEAETRFDGKVTERLGTFVEEVNGLQRSLQEQGTILRGEFTNRSAQLENAFSSLNGRFTAALAEGGSVQQLGNRLNTLEGRVGALNVVKLDADRVNDAVSRVDTIMALVRAGNRSLFQTARPIGDVEVATEGDKVKG